MAGSYDIGDLVRVTGTFTVGGTATDPTTITLKVMNPAGTTTTYTYALSQVTKSATGIYYKDVSPDTRGVWMYEWTGTGTCQAVDEGEFWVKDSRVP